MTTTTKPRTTRQPDAFAGQGAVRQGGGTLPVYTCNACGGDVVWATSARTERKYLANVLRGYHGQRYYIGANVHPRDCADTAKAEALEAERLAKRERAGIVLNRSVEASKRLFFHESAITKEQFLADLAFFEANYNADIEETR